MLISQDKLHPLIQNILQASGSDKEEAQIVADHLIRANLTGHDSHGIGMVPTYMKSLAEGVLRPNVVLKKTRDDGNFLQFNAQRGYGQRMAKEAMEYAIERCKGSGSVIMGLRNAHHIGRVGSYGEQSMRAGLISLHFVNVIDHRPLVAPYRGTDARYSTNPICFALPASERHPSILLDMATSKVALGKTRVAMNKHEAMPEGILLDGCGHQTTDPSVMFQKPFGAITALGDHKGYGIALFCELLAGGLSGGGTIQEENERKGGIVNNMLTILVDPERLVDLAWLHQETEKVINYIKSSPAANEAEPVLIPGEPERLSYQLRMEHGIQVDDTTWGQIEEIASAMNLSLNG